MRPIDAVGYLGLGLLVVAAFTRLAVQGSGAPALLLAVLGVALFLVYFFRAGRDVQRFLGRRSTREGGGVLATTFFVLGTLVLVNVLASRFRVREDVTEDRLFTLAPETIRALREAPEPPRVDVFYPEGDPTAARLQALLEAAAMAEPRLAYEVVDPDRDPVRASRFNLIDYAAVVTVGERFEPFLGADETQFVAALVRASRSKRPRVAFLKGHGESSPEDDSPEGVRAAASALDLRGFPVVVRDFAQGRGLADSVDVLVVTGPRVPFTETEEDSVIRFLDQGGRLLLLLDPSRSTALDRVLARNGIRFRSALLEDPDLHDPGMLVPVEYSGHPVVQGLRNARIPVVFPGAGEVEIVERRDDLRQAAIMRSGPRTVAPGDSADAPRSRSLCVAAEWHGSEGRIGRLVVLGDADFATGRHVGRGGNADLFTAAAQWLAEEEVLIEIAPRTRTDRPLAIARHQGRALMVLTTGLLPLGVLVAGTVVWWRRR